jgi:hypothetical protein
VGYREGCTQQKSYSTIYCYIKWQVKKVVVEFKGENEGLEQQSSRKNETQPARNARRAEVPVLQST